LRLARNGQRLLAVLVAVIGCAALLAGVPSRASAAALPSVAALSSATWTATNSAASATGVGYTFTFMPATTATLNNVVITLPSGVGGTPSLGTVTPSTITPGGSLAVSGSTLTYAFTAATVQAGRVLAIGLTGLSNPFALVSTTPSTTITTRNGTTAVDSGTASFTFGSGQVTNVTGSASPATVGASATYNFGFTLGLSLTVTSITLTVPPGTTGTPSISSISPSGLVSIGSASISLDTSTNTLRITVLNVGISGAVSIQVTGLTNTPTAGSYQTEAVAFGVLSGQSGVSATPLTFPAGLWAGGPAALSWSGSLNGQNQALVDATAADQLMTVDDQTNSAAGWHLTVSTTNFVNSAAGYTLPQSAVLGVTGSTAGLFTSTPPTAACSGSAACTLPDTSAVTYPVMINSSASSPVAATVYDAKAGTGVGLMSLGGSAAASPVGWWVNVPAVAAAGTYSSTLTLTVATGP
jgi:hypothetical protein